MLGFVVALVALQVVLGDHAPREFTVLMDISPDQRWNEVVAAYKEPLRTLVNEVLAEIPSEYHPMAMEIAEEADQWLPEPFASELKGISRASGVSLANVTVANLLYEMVATKRSGYKACTGVIAQDASGVIYHGRNLDFSMTEAMRACTVTVHFMEKGRHLYTYTGQVGLVGFWTAQKPGAFTVEGNERNVGSLKDNLMALKRHTLPPSMLLRKAVIEQPDYSSVVHVLSTSDVAAPVYFIVGGMKGGEGVVITRNITGADVWPMAKAYDGWYVVQTNYDHWNAPPKGDDRRGDALQAIKTKIGSPSNLTPDTLFDVMSTPRVLNSGTIFTGIMSASKPSVYRAVIRDA